MVGNFARSSLITGSREKRLDSSSVTFWTVDTSVGKNKICHASREGTTLVNWFAKLLLRVLSQ